ncbi:hypothetical protein OBBRIDRAFT_836531 [Obba rivulosa]|uniref:Uncharacterized protein n=1 Tax=Obba rivulosa TaxID=1052685 RepID=A0A8E2AQI8_9APHY|nr:hypothetical protein OBBRIDRAFT_836531 [Obba rivulosa]
MSDDCRDKGLGPYMLLCERILELGNKLPVGTTVVKVSTLFTVPFVTVDVRTTVVKTVVWPVLVPDRDVVVGKVDEEMDENDTVGFVEGDNGGSEEAGDEGCNTGRKEIEGCVLSEADIDGGLREEVVGAFCVENTVTDVDIEIIFDGGNAVTDDAEDNPELDGAARPVLDTWIESDTVVPATLPFVVGTELTLELERRLPLEKDVMAVFDEDELADEAELVLALALDIELTVVSENTELELDTEAGADEDERADEALEDMLDMLDTVGSMEIDRESEIEASADDETLVTDAVVPGPELESE